MMAFLALPREFNQPEARSQQQDVLNARKKKQNVCRNVRSSALRSAMRERMLRKVANWREKSVTRQDKNSQLISAPAQSRTLKKAPLLRSSTWTLFQQCSPMVAVHPNICS
jgi:hypothetical protein